MRSGVGIGAILMMCVTFTGTLNNFTGRISAAVLGKYNGLVGGVLSASIYMLFNISALLVQHLRGRPVFQQFRNVMRGFCGAGGCRYHECGVWKFLVLAGVSDVFNSITGLVAQPHLSTLMFSLMNQACVPFTVFFSMLLIGSRYVALEIFSVITVGCAAVLAVVGPGDESDISMDSEKVFWGAFAALTTSFAALSFVLKEKAFSGYHEDLALDGEIGRHTSGSLKVYLMQDDADENIDAPAESSNDLDVFVVGTVVSTVGFVFVAPVGVLIHHLTSPEPTLPAMVEGFKFLASSQEAILAYAAYAVVNILFNLSLLLTTGRVSALMGFMSLKLAVPCTAILSQLPWPVIGAKGVSTTQWIVLLVMGAGISAFRFGNMQNKKIQKKIQKTKKRVCCWPICA